MNKLTLIQKSVMIEDVFRKIIQLEREVDVEPDPVKSIAISRRYGILSAFGVTSEQLMKIRRIEHTKAAA